jgi:ElaA protein
MPLTYRLYEFTELTRDLLYDILALRAEVFVMEQNSVYIDADGYDQICLHLCAFEGRKLAGYTRIYPPGTHYKRFEEVAFGRFVLRKDFRGGGNGRALLEQVLKVIRDRFGNPAIKIEAQAYLEKFYNGQGFVRQGDIYILDNVPHCDMRRGPEPDRP